MGQEQSSPVDDSTPSRTLRERSVDAVAEYIKDGRAKKIVVLVSLSYNSIEIVVVSNPHLIASHIVVTGWGWH